MALRTSFGAPFLSHTGAVAASGRKFRRRRMGRLHSFTTARSCPRGEQGFLLGRYPASTLDDFPLDRTELNGSLITLEFGGGGRIHQMWVADPNLPEYAQEYQFILPGLTFGEEFAEDSYPGTILLGARLRPDDPWVLDRNKTANAIEAPDDPKLATFEYDFSLLSELRVTGRFSEVTQPFPQIVWDVIIENQARVSVEIGELAFPMAFNNLFEGDSLQDDRKPSPVGDRVRLHPFVGGDASYLFAQRTSGEPPGLLVFPGEGTAWELWTSVPASLNTPLRWGGIPVFYVLSRAALEREGWGEGSGAASSVVLEPGDARTFQTRFVATGGDGHDGALQTLALCGRPAVKLLPGAVAPRDVGIAVETAGLVPNRFTLSQKAELEIDTDEQGGFCFVRPQQAGASTLSFSDARGRIGQIQLYFTEPIETLIKARAAFISARQWKEAPGSAFHHAFLPMNVRTMALIDGMDTLGQAFPVDSGLADALFLAEKNALYPDAEEIRRLDAFIVDFIEDDLQNPADSSVGSAFVDTSSVAIHYGHAQTYALLFNFYHSMARVAGNTELAKHDAQTYLKQAFLTARAMFRWALAAGTQGVSTLSQIRRLVEDLRLAGLVEEAEELARSAYGHAANVAAAAAKSPMDWAWDPGTYEEVLWAARTFGDAELAFKGFRQWTALRGLGPSWYSYGSDHRIPFESGANHPAFGDRGALTLGHSCVPLSAHYFSLCELDYDHIADGPMRLAFGGMLAPWAMVRPDGAASMGFCQDPASRQYGSSIWTGDLGVGLFTYLREAASWVFPSRSLGLYTFGCHFESREDSYEVRPWDGVGRRVVMRQIGFDCRADFGKIQRLNLHVRKRWVELDIVNPSPAAAKSRVQFQGLWGRKFDFEGKSIQPVDGQVTVEVELPPSGKAHCEVRALEP